MDCKWNLIERTSEEELEKRKTPSCVLRVVEFLIASTDGSWRGLAEGLIEAAAVEGVTTSTFGKFLAQHNVFMRLRGVTYSKSTRAPGKLSRLNESFVKGVSNEGCRRVKQPAFSAFMAFTQQNSLEAFRMLTRF